MYKCKYCNKEFVKYSSLCGHLGSCEIKFKVLGQEFKIKRLKEGRKRGGDCTFFSEKYINSVLKMSPVEYYNKLIKSKEWTDGYQLKHMLKVLKGIDPNRCQLCGWSEVNLYTNTVPVEVHHIDGNNCNNELDNLQILCPNCHSLTKGYKGNNRK